MPIIPPNQARGLAQDRRRIVDMAQQRMRDHGVKDAIAEIKSAAIACAKFHAITQPFVCRQPGCGLRQCRAQIDAEHPARKIAAASDRAGGDTGAAAR